MSSKPIKPSWRWDESVHQWAKALKQFVDIMVEEGFTREEAMQLSISLMDKSMDQYDKAFSQSSVNGQNNPSGAFTQ